MGIYSSNDFDQSGMCGMSCYTIDILNNMQVNLLFLGSSLYKVYQERRRRFKFSAKEQSRFDVAWYWFNIRYLTFCCVLPKVTSLH